MNKEINYKNMYEKRIKDALQQIDHSNTNLVFHTLDEKYIDEEEQAYTGYDTYYILSLWGGLNGPGRLLFYLEDVEKIVKKLMIIFDSVWLIKLDNDCADDVFELQLGLHN